MSVSPSSFERIPVLPRLRLLAALAVAAVVLAAAPAAAQAGTYTVSVDTSADISGWQFFHDAGFYGCSIAAHPGPCADGDVPSPTQLRIFAYGDAIHTNNAYWQWLAPPTTTITAGSVGVTYRTAATSTYVYMKARLRSESFTTSPQLHPSDGNATVTWSIPAGNQAVGVFLKTDVDRSYTDKWNNNVRIASLTATLADDTAPAVALSGTLASGAWLNQTQAVCLQVAATDAGAGVASAVLRDGPQTLASATVPQQSASQPGAVSYTHQLCTVPSALGDGLHTLHVVVTDAAGEATDTPVDVRVDATAPAAFGMTPAAPTTDLRPAVAFSVDPGPSGLGTFDAALDGQPMQVTGADASSQPAADLAYGTHTVTFHATDGAGNTRDGFWTFRVIDTVPPELANPAPADGSSGEDRRPQIAFDLSDAGTGVDPATLHVVLDGTDVAAAGTYAGGHFAYTPAAALTYASHHVRVAVSDRSGNAMTPVEWSFSVVDTTAPVLGDLTPRDGSSGSDRTPPIAVAITDAGSGVDPATIAVSLDGADVSAQGAFAGGRFSYTPAAPLAYGVHTATAAASDRSGNVSATATWSFTVADEQAPAVTGRKPVPGTTVPGAAAVEFDVSDAGTGLDPASLSVGVDGSDVTGWGTFSGGHFSYAPGNLGAGVHTVSVTAADLAGNVAGPVMWQFAVADPATLAVAAAGGPASIVAGASATLRFAATGNGSPLAGARVLVSARPAGAAAFGPARVLVASATGLVSWSVGPMRTTVYRVQLEADPAVSAARTLVVRQRVTLTASVTRLRRGGAFTLSGRVLPAHPGGRVQIQLLTAAGWRTVASPLLGARSAFRKTLVAAVPGRYVLRAVAAATAADAAGASPAVSVRVL